MTTCDEAHGCFTVRHSILVHAPIDRCFQLTCSIQLVHEQLGMSVVGGRTDRLVVGGEVVRWEGWQLGLKHFHVSHISSYERPVFLQDTMLDGRFKTFQHDHHLREVVDRTSPEKSGTLLEDELRFTLPFGKAGELVARHIMVPHIHRLMTRRFAQIKQISECEDWRKYLVGAE